MVVAGGIRQRHRKIIQLIEDAGNCTPVRRHHRDTDGLGRGDVALVISGNRSREYKLLLQRWRVVSLGDACQITRRRVARVAFACAVEIGLASLRITSEHIENVCVRPAA